MSRLRHEGSEAQNGKHVELHLSEVPAAQIQEGLRQEGLRGSEEDQAAYEESRRKNQEEQAGHQEGRRAKEDQTRE